MGVRGTDPPHSRKFEYNLTLSPPYHIHGFSQLWIESIQGKKDFQKLPKKQNLNMPHAGNYLRGIYILLGL